MIVEILGTGCKRCDQLYENSLAAVSQLDAASGIEVKKVNDVNYFLSKGVFVTPGLIIDGTVVAVGKVLSPEEIREKIRESL